MEFGLLMGKKYKMSNMKFRAYNINAKEWVEGAWMYQSGKLDHDTIPNPPRTLVSQFYTGLKDKNDGAIYENPKVLNIKIEDFLAQQIYRKIK
jgi:hypothetical protein